MRHAAGCRPTRVRRVFGSRALILMMVVVASWLGAISPARAGEAAGSSGDELTVDTRGDTPNAAVTPADPTVGPLFVHGLAQGHSCTASVLAGTEDLLLTAAHCITGTGAGIQFVPGYDGTAATTKPYGVWTVERAWVDPAWAQSRDPQHDYAILRVAAQARSGSIVHVENVTGGNEIGLDNNAGTTVTVTAYLAGQDDAPVSCTMVTFDQQGFPGFRCGGYLGGTSGAPWLVGTDRPGVHQVIGLIGGLNQGGCRSDVSYSPQLSLDIYVDVILALIDPFGDTVPSPGSDGC